MKTEMIPLALLDEEDYSIFDPGPVTVHRGALGLTEHQEQICVSVCVCVFS